jgi:hypothetical protein
MKQKIIFGLIALIAMTGLVSAGSVELNYEDCTDTDNECINGYWWRGHFICTQWQEVCEHSIDRTIIDTDATIDSDTWNGMNMSDFRDTVSVTTISSSGGVSSDWVLRMIDSAKQWVSDWFATKDDMTKLRARVDLLEKRLEVLTNGLVKPASEEKIDIELCLKKAKETGKEQQSGEWYCSPKGFYYTLN